MSDVKNLEQATAVFRSVCNVLDGYEWKYDADTDKLTIRLKLSGDDLPMDFVIRVLEKQQVISILSFMPTNMPEDKRIGGAIATTIVTNKLADGSFDYDFMENTVTFRITASFLDSLISEELVDYLIRTACSTVDEYNHHFDALAKGTMTLDELFEIK